MAFGRNNMKWKYLRKCLANQGNKVFVDDVLHFLETADMLKIRHEGSENFGKIIYVISEQGCGWGFFAEMRGTWAKMLYAERLGMIPVVEYGSSFSYYEKGVEFTSNAYEYYFEQPSSVKHVHQSANIVYGDLIHSHSVEMEYGNKGYYVQDKYVSDIAEIVKKYVKFNLKTREYLMENYSKMATDKKVLGVHYRGSDFKKKFNTHPIPLTIDQTMDAVKMCWDSGKYDAIFLATDDREAVSRFAEKFGDNLLYYQDVIRAEGDVSVAFSLSEREHHKYKLGLEVLRDVYTLSQCEGLVCGLSQVGFAARVFKKSYEKEYEDYLLIDNGICSNTNQFGK